MSIVLRIKRKSMKRAKEVLIKHNLYSPVLSAGKIIDLIIQLADDEPILDSEEAGAFRLKSKLSSFASATGLDNKEEPLPGEIQDLLIQTMSEVCPDEDTVVEYNAKGEAIQTETKKFPPPWESLTKLPMDYILSKFPKHEAISWAGEDPFKVMAIRSSFHITDSKRVLPLAKSLLIEFEKYLKENK